jgi:hypothetical protein
LEIDYTGVTDLTPLCKLRSLRHVLIEGLDEDAVAPSLAKLEAALPDCDVSWAS